MNSVPKKHPNEKGLLTLEEVLKVVPERKVVVQAGGNLGFFPKRLSEEFEAVYTFEPSEILFPTLCANASAKNVYRYQAALGCEPGFMQTLLPENRKGLGKTFVMPGGNIPTLLLDDFAFQVLDLLYLDVEGYELFAIKGALKTIKRCRPIIAVEINNLSLRYNYTGDELRNTLISLGYNKKFRMNEDEIFVL